MVSSPSSHSRVSFPWNLRSDISIFSGASTRSLLKNSSFSVTCSLLNIFIWAEIVVYWNIFLRWTSSILKKFSFRKICSLLEYFSLQYSFYFIEIFFHRSDLSSRAYCCQIISLYFIDFFFGMACRLLKYFSFSWACSLFCTTSSSVKYLAFSFAFSLLTYFSFRRAFCLLFFFQKGF